MFPLFQKIYSFLIISSTLLLSVDSCSKRQSRNRVKPAKFGPKLRKVPRPKRESVFEELSFEDSTDSKLEGNSKIYILPTKRRFAPQYKRFLKPSVSQQPGELNAIDKLRSRRRKQVNPNPFSAWLSLFFAGSSSGKNTLF